METTFETQLKRNGAAWIPEHAASYKLSHVDIHGKEQPCLIREHMGQRDTITGIHSIPFDNLSQAIQYALQDARMRFFSKP